MWGHSQTMDWTCIPGIARQILIHCTIREILTVFISRSHEGKHAQNTQNLLPTNTFSFHDVKTEYPLDSPLNIAFVEQAISQALCKVFYNVSAVDPARGLCMHQGQSSLDAKCFLRGSKAGWIENATLLGRVTSHPRFPVLKEFPDAGLAVLKPRWPVHPAPRKSRGAAPSIMVNSRYIILVEIQNGPLASQIVS